MLTVGLLRLDVYISLYSLGLGLHYYIGLTKITQFCGNKRTFLQTPPPSTDLLSTPTPTKNKTAYVHFYRVSQSAYWSELDILSLRCQIQQLIPHAPTRRRLKKKKKKKKRLCVVFELLAGYDPGTRALPLSYRNQLQPRTLQSMYLYSIWRLGPYDLRPVQSHNSNFD